MTASFYGRVVPWEARDGVIIPALRTDNGVEMPFLLERWMGKKVEILITERTDDCEHEDCFEPAVADLVLGGPRLLAACEAHMREWVDNYGATVAWRAT